jgi:GT2 family glycosyltransferase
MTLNDQVIETQMSHTHTTHALASVIVVSYNNRDYLGACLDSILRTLPPGCEVLFLDNGSSDGSANFVEKGYPKVRKFCSSSNLGFAGGNNLVADSARGEYLVFLNPDTIVEPGWLEALLAPLQACSQAGLATSQILLLHSPAIINTCGNEIHLSGLTLCRGAGLKRGSLATQTEVTAISGAAFAIRRELFEKLGGFDENFFLYMEDSDLSWRARLAGFECIYVPTSIVYHDYLLRFRPNKIFYQEKNRYMMLLKNLRWGSLVLLLPALLLAEVVTWGFVIARGGGLWQQKFQAYAWVIRNMYEILAHRKQTQTLRKCSDRQLLGAHTWKLDFEQTSPSSMATLAHFVFGPLYWFMKGLVYLLIWW